MTRLVLFQLFVTNLLLFGHQQQQNNKQNNNNNDNNNNNNNNNNKQTKKPNKKLLFSWQFSGSYGVTKHGSGWRKDVVNQCLEYGSTPVYSSLKLRIRLTQ